MSEDVLMDSPDLFEDFVECMEVDPFANDDNETGIHMIPILGSYLIVF